MPIAAILLIAALPSARSEPRASSNDEISRALGGDHWKPPAGRISPPPEATKPSRKAQSESLPADSSPSLSEIDQIRRRVREYAEQKGETAEQFARRVGSTQVEIEGFVYGIMKNGGEPYGALRSIEGMSIAIKDPGKRIMIECLGVKIFNYPQTFGRDPTPRECDEAKRQRGLR